MKAVVKSVVLGASLMLGLSVPAFAQGDSSSDAVGGFHQVQQSTAVVIRVPLNAQGLEQTDAADMRLVTGADLSTSTSAEDAFAHGQDLSQERLVSTADVSRDSSTFGWFGWRNNGCYNNYYYNYQPSYYYYGNYYRYNYGGYYNNWNSGGGYGYRYYYYNRCW